ncbi:hypothetical protein DFA_12100 [Cavenderia fasciculata]|uniref:SET domain-containing protein n=1 Tax=Cavenderia fasciculata TaxID=261658 RepID=F4QFT3_CACFS|nr:uncharacterized protein DFA_12100 [Cavenderia fasciculata]EGG14330.1 hypothetical protein DFA_12100 [Cavenderia fasciculata]|eukprot:XP_004351039.1 hypothetical protein DFA_12100 [Cavenderia fasciculata]
MSYRIDETNKEIGRDVKSCESMTKGSLLFEEQSFASIPLSLTSNLCMLCCSSLVEKQATTTTTPTEKTAVTSSVECTYGCGYKFCTEKCMSDIVHQLECSFINRTEQASREEGIDLYFALLLLRILIKKHVENDRFNETVGRLSSNREAFKTNNPTWLAKQQRFADTLNKYLVNDKVEESLLSFFDHDEIVNTACTIITNSFGETSNNTTITNGFFYQAALLNHSCQPNAFFSFNGDKLQMRVVKDMDKDDSIYDSYVDLLLPTYERQLGLLKSKNFFCQCKRCSTREDCHLSSINCVGKDCQSWIAPLIGKKENKEDGSTSLTVTWGCDDCTGTASESHVKNIQDQLVSFTKYLEKRSYRENADRFVEQASVTMAQLENKIHKNHHARLQYHLHMSNAYIKLQQFNESIYHAKVVKRLVKNVLQCDRGELVDCYKTIGQLFEQLFIWCVSQRMNAQEQQSNTIVSPQAMRNYLAESHKYYLKAHQVASICYGQDHQQSTNLQSLIKKTDITMAAVTITPN